MIKGNNAISSIFKGDIVIDKIIKGLVTVYEAFKKLLVSGIPPLKLLKGKGEDLVDYKIYGESIQKVDTSNIWDGAYTKGSYYGTNGEIIENDQVSMSSFIELKYNVYNIKSVINSNNIFNFRYNFFDENKVWLSQILVAVTTTEPVITKANVPSGAKYMTFSVFTTQMDAGQEIYASEESTPTMNTPIEIESVGDKTSNIFNQSTTKISSFSSSANTNARKFEEGVWYRGLTYNNYSYPNNLLDYKLEEHTTMIKVNGQKAYGLAQAVKTEPNKTYIFNSDYAPEGVVGFGFYDKDGNFLNFITRFKGQVVETPDNAYWMTVCISGTVADVEINFSNIQLVLGDALPTYEPYGYKIPVKVRGKNHLNIEHFGDINNWDTSSTYGFYEISLPNGNYIYNFETDLTSYKNNILMLNKVKSTSTNPIKTLINGYSQIESKQGKFTISNNEKIYLNWYALNKNQSSLTNLINDVLNNFIIEDGDTFTGYEPYYKPISFLGKNLINKNKSQANKYINSSGAIGSSSGYGLSITDNIKVKPSTSYVYSGMGNVTGTTVTRTGYQYDKDGNPLKAIANSSGQVVAFKTEPNCAYVVLQYVKTEASPMLEEGEKATTYEPYKETVPTIYLKQPLRKVGDYADYIDFENQKLFRIINKVTYNGAEAWSTYGENRQYYSYTRALDTALMVSTGKNCLCNRLPAVQGYSSLWYGTALGCYVGMLSSGATKTSVAVSSEKPTTTEFREELAEKPLEIFYIGKTVSEEDITLPNMPTHKGTSIIEVDTTIQPSNMEVTYLGKE